jgi:hypothetical protein
MRRGRRHRGGARALARGGVMSKHWALRGGVMGELPTSLRAFGTRQGVSMNGNSEPAPGETIRVIDAAISPLRRLAVTAVGSALLRERLWSVAIGVVGFTTVVLVSRPGFMSPDSVDQLQQARNLSFSDDHPPLMALIWAGLDAVVPGPLGMLLLFNALYWGALVACFRRLSLPPPLRLACLAITAFLPPLYVNLGVIWKDILMQGALLALLASCLSFARARRTSALALALFWSTLAIGSRHNASAAVWPLLAFAAAAHPRLASLSGMRRATAALATSFVAIVLIYQALAVAFRPFTRETHFWQTTALFDLAGTSLEEKEVLFDRDIGSLRDGATLADIARSYSPRDHLELYRCRKRGCRPLLAGIEEPDKLALLARNWLSVVSHHPLAYLRHRAVVYRHLIGLEEQPVVNFPFIVKNPWGYVPHPSGIRNVVVGMLDRLVPTPLFSPWIYLLISCATFVLGGVAVARGGSALPLVLSASGLLYHATFFFLAGSPNYRYSLWTMMCAVLAALALHGALGAIRSLGTRRDRYVAQAA